MLAPNIFKIMRPIVFCLSLVSATSAFSDTLSPIIIGKSNGASGVTGQVGQGMILGNKIYVAKINEQGGILNHKIEVIAKDDGYEPVKAAENVRKLITKDNVLALVGNNGSPTTVVVLPIVDEQKVLLFGTYSGAPFLRTSPPDRYVFNLRVGFAEEVMTMVKGLLSHGVKPNELAFFIQDDAYGNSVLQGGIQALKAAGYSNIDAIPVGRYTRNTLNVEGALSQILERTKDAPKAVILGGNFDENTKFITLAHKDFPKAYFLPVTGQANIKTLSNAEQEKIITTQVVPPFGSNLPAIKEYLQDLQKYGDGATANYISLEGYLGTKLFIIALQKAVAEGKATREGIIDVLENLHDVDLGIGEKIFFNKNNHQALHRVWITTAKDGEFIPFNWSELKLK